MKVSDNWKSDRGSVLIFGIGLSILLLMLVTVSVNIVSIWSTKVTLRTIADAAALSGAQGVDVDAIYQSGFKSNIKLSPRLVHQRVSNYLNQPRVQNRLPGLRVLETQVHNNQVKVVLSCDSQMPFGYLLPQKPQRIQAVAIARQITN